MTEPKQPSIDKDALRARLQKEIFGQLNDRRAQVRLVVTAEIIRIVGDEIAEGKPREPERWEKLRTMVRGQSGAGELVDRLDQSLTQCEKEIEEQLQAGGADEKLIRSVAAKQIRIALTQMLRSPLPPDDQPKA